MKKDNEPKAGPDKPPITTADVPTVGIMAAIFAAVNQYSPEQAATAAATQFVCVKYQQSISRAKWEDAHPNEDFPE